jgi:dihydrofolate synthase/folylpolyglutamate synthase
MFDPDPQLDSLLQRLLHPKLKQIDPSLGRTERILAHLGNPQHQLPPVVHVAGTNGKGSLIAFLRAMLTAAGYRVHSYTSPHLVSFCERIRLQEVPISKAQLLPLIEQILALQEDYPTTFFEATTVLALLAFQQSPADVILLETGMGGRLDATNIFPQPLVTVITPIGMDHQEFLGNRLAQIAAEKAGIIKQNRPVVTGPQLPQAQQVLKAKAQAMDAPLYACGQEWNFKLEQNGWSYNGQACHRNLPVPGLLGEHQFANAATALAVLEQMAGFSVPREAIEQGLRAVEWPARLQPLTSNYWRDQLPQGFELYLDGGHNPMAAERIADWLSKQSDKRPVYMICAMLEDKDIRGFFHAFKGFNIRLYTIPLAAEKKACDPGMLAKIAVEHGLQAQMEESLQDALKSIAQQPAGILLITGSLYLAGHVLTQS